MKKRGSVWIWILIVLILALIAGAVGYYVWINMEKDFPKTIEGYALQEKNANDKNECADLEGTRVCFQIGRFEYVDQDNMAVHVLPAKITSGKEEYISFLKSRASESNIDLVEGVYRGAEPWEIYWFTEGQYDSITIQDYKYYPQADGGMKAQALNATTNNPVVQWFLEEYPPIVPE